MKDNFTCIYNKIRNHRRESIDKDLNPKREVFETVIFGNHFLVDVYPAPFGFIASVPGMYDPFHPSSQYAVFSVKSGEDALLQLVENIEEQILTNRI